MDVLRLSTEQRLGIVFRRAAARLPAEAGRQLLQFVTPEALAVIAAVVAVWAGSHFFGVGEVADAVLLVTGWIALGSAALTGCRKLVDFGIGTVRAKTEADLDKAAADLAEAVAILGINLVLSLLFKGRPRGTFVESFKGELPPFAAAADRLPASGPFRMIEAELIFTKGKWIGLGGTDGYNVARVGRDWVPGSVKLETALEAVRETVFHERVHQRISQFFSLFGKRGQYLAKGAYRRSVILRYLEEAAAEAVGKSQTHGTREAVLMAIRFPIEGPYAITLVKMGLEARGVLLGPVIVGGVTYNVYLDNRDLIPNSR